MDKITVNFDAGKWVVADSDAYKLNRVGSNRLLLVLDEIESQYTTDSVKCDICGHEWIAVHPFSKQLECPKCERMVDRS